MPGLWVGLQFQAQWGGGGGQADPRFSPIDVSLSLKLKKYI